MVLVPLILRATDQASSVINKVSGALGGLNRPVNQAAQGMGGLTGQITQGIVQANLLTGAFTTALGAAQRGIGAVQNAFVQGSELQLQGITAATTFSSLTGQSYEEATAFIDRFNSAIAKSAADLPGATAEYSYLGRTVQDNLINAFKDESGVLQMGEFEGALMGISEAYGALTAASTKDIGNTALGLTKALSGGSIAELRSIAFFEQNPIILNEIEKRLEAIGEDSLAELGDRQRVQLLQEVGQKFINEDFKEAASTSVDGLMQSFQSYILDPTNGIFGIMKDLNPSLAGTQSAFSSMNESVKLLIGPDGIFFQAEELFKEAGVGFSPMLTLKTGIDRFNSFLTNINDRFTNLNEALDEGGSLTNMFSTYVKDAIADAKPFIKNFSGQLFSRLGDLIPPVVNFLSEAIIGAGKALYLVFDNIDYGSALISLGDALKGINWGRVAIAAGVVLGGAIIGGLTLGAVAIVGPIGLALGAAGVGIAGVISSTLQGRSEDLRMIFVGMWNSIKFPFINLFTDMRIAFTNLKTAATSLVDQVKTAIIALLTGLRDRLDFIPGVSRIQIPGTVQAGTGTGSAQLGALGLRPVAGSRADGQMPSAFGALLSAAQTESRNAPTGASLVVANTSEAIIPRSTVRAVQPIAATGGGGRSLQLAAGAIQVNEARTPTLTAEAIYQMLQSKFEQEYNTQLT